MVLGFLRDTSPEKFADDPPSLQATKAVALLSGLSDARALFDDRSNRIYVQVRDGGLVEGKRLDLVERFLDLEAIAPSRVGDQVDYVFRIRKNGSNGQEIVRGNGANGSPIIKYENWKTPIRNIIGGDKSVADIVMLRKQGREIDLVLSETHIILGSQMAEIQRNYKVELVGLDAMRQNSLHLWLKANS